MTRRRMAVRFDRARAAARTSADLRWRRGSACRGSRGSRRPSRQRSRDLRACRRARGRRCARSRGSRASARSPGVSRLARGHRPACAAGRAHRDAAPARDHREQLAERRRPGSRRRRRPRTNRATSARRAARRRVASDRRRPRRARCRRGSGTAFVRYDLTRVTAERECADRDRRQLQIAELPRDRLRAGTRARACHRRLRDRPSRGAGPRTRRRRRPARAG